MAASNTDDRDDDLPDEPTPPADRSEDAGPGTNDREADTGELADETVDARFADLVASLGDLGAGTSGSATRTSVPDTPDPPGGPHRAGARPDGTDADRAAAGPGDDERGDGSAAVARPPDDDRPFGARGEMPDGRSAPPGVSRPSGPRDWPVTPEVEALEEADTHFTPPEPEPLLSDKDPLLTMAWIAVAGIPVLALVSVIAVAAIPALNIPALVGQVALGLFVAGLGVLLWRMPHHRDPEDDDPGAVV
ncbi:hypothetical protein [Myceligenerans salitolerans]|uniref:DUF308 domain-containing protein n=1 Tax=Myceligenerans salitolerans TaxID=1230528 RepID=A0ABS3ID01_9MICO|nr:hypothetical protein [Myceligenerans salitolerans]MBO0610823.1 hypothetical protein [Myceligenerans salitolerans]